MTNKFLKSSAKHDGNHPNRGSPLKLKTQTQSALTSTRFLSENGVAVKIAKQVIGKIRNLLNHMKKSCITNTTDAVNYTPPTTF